jgi:hypothetical protein
VPTGSFFLGSAGGVLAGDFAVVADMFGSGWSGNAIGMPKRKVRVGCPA